MRLEEALEWAAANEFAYADVCVDNPPNALGSFDEARVRGVRAALDRHGIHLGLHTLSAVNVAETSPYLRDAVDRYLEAYMDLASASAPAGSWSTPATTSPSDLERRKAAALERLKRAVGAGREQGVQLLLENMNPEPDDAEVHYLAHDVAECRYYFDQLTSPHLGWAYTVNHAHMLPEGIAGFTPLFDLGRCGEVRLADNRGEVEEHLQPGDGTIDFKAMFDQIEGAGYRKHYMMAFGSIDDMRRGREHLVAVAGRD